MKTQTQKTPPEKRPGSRGFTLIEVMIAVAIIAVLALVVSVMARNSKKKALEASAMGPMRQVAMANVAFSLDNHSKINTLKWKDDPEEGTGGFVRNSFWGRLGPYLFPDVGETNQNKLKKELKLRLNSFFSTSDASKMTGTWLQGSKVYHDGSGLPVPFAFNDQLYQYNNWVRMNKVRDTSQIMYITYGFGIFNEADGQQADPRPTDGSKPSNNIYYLDNGKAMVSFLDGRVELIPAPIPTRRFQ